MVPQWGALVAFVEDKSSVPDTHVKAHRRQQLQVQTLQEVWEPLLTFMSIRLQCGTHPSIQENIQTRIKTSVGEKT